MFTGYVIAPGSNHQYLEHCDTFDTVDEAIASILKHWNEDESGPQTFIVQDDDSNTVATLTRDLKDPEVAHVMDQHYKVRHWKCTYIVDENDKYISTRVVEIK